LIQEKYCIPSHFEADIICQKKVLGDDQDDRCENKTDLVNLILGDEDDKNLEEEEILHLVCLIVWIQYYLLKRLMRPPLFF